MSTTLHGRGSGTPRSCAARWHMDGSGRSTPRAALAMPGVHAVVTAQDVGRPIPTIPFRRPNPTIAPYAQPVLADDVVRYVGEPVAVVLADSAERAEDAAQAVALDIEHLPAVADRQASGRGDVAADRGHGEQLRRGVHRQCRRCRRGLPQGGLHPPRAVPRAADDRHDHGDARAAGGVGCRRRAAQRIGCGQAAVLQPPRHGGDDESAGGSGRLCRI